MYGDRPVCAKIVVHIMESFVLCPPLFGEFVKKDSTTCNTNIMHTT